LNLADKEPAKMAMGADYAFFDRWCLGRKRLIALISLYALARNNGYIGGDLLASLDHVKVSWSNDHNLLKHCVRDSRV